MKELKKSANWYIAATHYLTAGLAVPFIISLIVGATVLLFHITSHSLIIIISVVTYFVSIWLGVKYAASYLNKTYIISDKEKIVLLATVYFLVTRLGFFLMVLNRENITNLLSILAGIFIFYYFSKKYIKENSNASAINQNGSSAT